MSGHQPQTTGRTGHNISGCDNIVSFADFAARMEKKSRSFARTQSIATRAAASPSSVIYIGDLR